MDTSACSHQSLMSKDFSQHPYFSVLAYSSTKFESMTSGSSSKMKALRLTFLLLFIPAMVLIFILAGLTSRADRHISTMGRPPNIVPIQISEQTFTRLNNTKHLLVSAFMDQRRKGLDIRIIGIFKRDSINPLNCYFWCDGHMSVPTPSEIMVHSDHFGFPYGTTDVMCPIPENCSATHVTLVTRPNSDIEPDQLWLPIRNKEMKDNVNDTFQFDFTVCISNLFGDYNNVLQVAQTLEMYRLLSVDRVVIYNTSCGPELDRLLQAYIQEGFVEVVPWPIDQYLSPSEGWLFSKHGGELHYYGQLTSLNECIYRSMARSRYVLLNDMDEIVMPYQHTNLTSLMDMLQQQHPNTGVFLIENRYFPKKHFEPSKRFHLPQWNGVPGVNLLEHIYSEEPDRKVYHPHKIIIQPRMVEQTSVHEVLKKFGQVFKVPPQVCRLIHVRARLQEALTIDQLHVDKRLWEFHERLIPNVDVVLRRAGLLNRGAELMDE
ncbi:uncharacterized protein LOC131444920 isoform X1 [Solea solea]|uniref:uncharacterized protein LOC131444920 isoform X1 n=2 Tax=Solea solea TaxID=90069 RepID=UPI00272D6D79|nr:uncharacterized protein LOC131444920 isoform X1 [Solea solea]